MMGVTWGCLAWKWHNLCLMFDTVIETTVEVDEGDTVDGVNENS